MLGHKTEDIIEEGENSISSNLMQHVTELVKSKRLCLFWDRKSSLQVAS
jgi:hypothetical protein